MCKPIASVGWGAHVHGQPILVTESIIAHWIRNVFILVGNYSTATQSR